MNALFSVLGVMGSNLYQSKGMIPENDVSTKKVEFGEKFRDIFATFGAP